MSYRDYKQFAAKEFYHVYNRGNGKMDIFRDEQDYGNFLKRLRIVLGKYLSKGAFDTRIRLTALKPGDFSLVCYCLMPNHFHFCIGQNTTIPVSTPLLRICTSYAKYFNRKYGHVGHVFQDRFHAVHIESDTQLAAVSAYIHQNPKVAGLVNSPEGWSYSSYHEYVQELEIICDHRPVLNLFKDVSDYREFVEARYAEIRERKDFNLEP